MPTLTEALALVQKIVAEGLKLEGASELPLLEVSMCQGVVMIKVEGPYLPGNAKRGAEIEAYGVTPETALEELMSQYTSQVHALRMMNGIDSWEPVRSAIQ